MIMGQFRPNITKIMVPTFWMSGKTTDSRRRPQPASLVSCKPITVSQTRRDLKICVSQPARAKTRNVGADPPLSHVVAASVSLYLVALAAKY